MEPCAYLAEIPCPTVNELTFTANAAKWMEEIIKGNPSLPFSTVEIENKSLKSAKRNDFVIHGKNGKPLITGEAKMPDKLNGGSPLNETVIIDAQNKANDLGVEYFFTWNVNHLVLWETFQKGVPITERRIGFFDVMGDTPIRKSEQIASFTSEKKIKEFLAVFLQRCSEVLAGEVRLPVPPPDETFLRIWELALERPVDRTYNAIAYRFDETPLFKRDFQRWVVQAQGWQYSEKDGALLQENQRNAAKVSCYVLAIKVIFYKALRRRFAKLPDLAVPASVETASQLKSWFETCFGQAMTASGDYETVFRSDWGETLPFLTDAVVEDWRELCSQTDQFDFTKIDYEIIGQIFERMLSVEERHKWGQHYTRSEVVDLVNSFCIRNASDTVLDPACGGGTFLVRAYRRKSELSGGTLRHQELLQQVHGFDISAYPAHLTTVNLATRDLIDDANYPLVARRDFFTVEKGAKAFTIPYFKGKKCDEPVVLPELSAIVGNPPYIRQENINEGYTPPVYAGDYKGWLRSVVKPHTDTGELSARSDLFCYFFVHALPLLKSGGYVGLLVASNWLDTSYGFTLQKFLLDHFEIVAIFESNCEPWFTGARVTTSAVILREQKDKAKRDANTVRFAWLTKPLTDLFPPEAHGSPLASDAFRDRIEAMTGDTPFAIHLDGLDTVTVRQTTQAGIRARLVKQGDLYRLGTVAVAASGDADTEDDSDADDSLSTANPIAAQMSVTAGEYHGFKWGIFLRAPDIFFTLLRIGGTAWTPFGKVATIKFGLKSGCDKFFFVRDITDERLKEMGAELFTMTYGVTPAQTKTVRVVLAGDKSVHNIEAKYLEPIVFNLMEINAAEIDPALLKKKVLLVSADKSKLRGTEVLKYIEWGESQGFHNGASCANRERWHDLTWAEKGSLFWTKSQQYRHIVSLNQVDYICNCNLYYVNITDQINGDILCGILNSTLVALSKHQFGRVAGREGNLKTEVVDTKMMLIPDPRKATPEVARKITAAFASLRARPIGKLVDVDGRGAEPSGELAHTDRQALDDAVLELLGVSDPAKRAALRAELYREITTLYRTIRTAEKRMQEHRGASARAGTVTPRAIAEEIWESLYPQPVRRTLLERIIGKPADLVTLPKGRAVSSNTLFNPDSLAFGVKFVAFDSREQAGFAKALSDSGITGNVPIPRSPADCAAVLAAHDAEQSAIETSFAEKAAEYSSDDKRQQTIIRELWRLLAAT